VSLISFGERSRPPPFIPKKSCTHAPFIMKMTEVVTKKRFEKEVSHRSYRPVCSTNDGVGRRGREAALLYNSTSCP